MARYYIVDYVEMEVTTTDSPQVTRGYREDDTFMVIDTQENMLLDYDGTTKPIINAA